MRSFHGGSFLCHPKKGFAILHSPKRLGAIAQIDSIRGQLRLSLATRKLQSEHTAAEFIKNLQRRTCAPL